MALAALPHPHTSVPRDGPSAGRLLPPPGSPRGPGLLTDFCGQHCEVVPDTSLAVQGHCRADGTIFRLDGEAVLRVRVGEDGVSGEVEWGWGLICGRARACSYPSLPLFTLLGLMAQLGRGPELARDAHPEP